MEVFIKQKVFLHYALKCRNDGKVIAFFVNRQLAEDLQKTVLDHGLVCDIIPADDLQ